jgi:acyl-CoA thioester hydrolase
VNIDGSPVPVEVHQSRVEWMDTDAAGIYHNTAVVRFVEAAEAALMRAVGLDSYFAEAPRVHYEVEFESPVFFGQEVTTILRLDRVGGSSMTFAFEIWGEEFEGRPRTRAAFGRYVTVHIADTHSDGDVRSEPWPAAWVEALTRRALDGPPGPDRARRA